RLSATASEGAATIVVEDNGSGIDAELLPRVFELFVQGERGLDRRQGGLGIGLTLVKRLVELHNGRVEAHSDGPGSGSQFRIVLPSISAVQPELPAAPAITSSDVYGRRVLVVDDNIDAAERTAASSAPSIPASTTTSSSRPTRARSSAPSSTAGRPSAPPVRRNRARNYQVF